MRKTITATVALLTLPALTAPGLAWAAGNHAHDEDLSKDPWPPACDDEDLSLHSELDTLLKMREERRRMRSEARRGRGALRAR